MYGSQQEAGPQRGAGGLYGPLMGSATRKEVVVGVNGELIRIKRGVRVKIKKKFYRVLQQAADQELAAYRTMERAQEQGKRAVARL